MNRLAESIVLLWGPKRYVVAALAGAFSVLALPPFGFFPILFFTFPVLVWLIDGSAVVTRQRFFSSLRPAFAVGFWFGFGFFLAGLHWIGVAFLVEKEKFALLMPLGIVGLPFLLSFFTAFGCAIAKFFWSASPWRVVALAFGLGLADIARGTLFTGFPWNSFGYALTATDIQLQIVNLLGVYVLSVFAVFIFSAPAALADPEELGSVRRLPFLLGLALLLLQAGYGQQRLQKAHNATVEKVLLRIVQPNLTQEERLNPNKRDEIVDRLLSLSEKSRSEQPQTQDEPQPIPTHIIWPESTLPFLISSAPQVLSRIETMLQPGQVLIAGLARAEDGGAGASAAKLYNSIYVIDHDARVLDRYDKIHLVPFGEYLPFENLLRRIGLEPLTRRFGFEAGDRRQPMVTPLAPPFGPLICYESIFPGQIVEGGDRPSWLVNLSDDSWFGRTLGPYQHLHQAKVRAAEEGLPLVRSTTTGISALIDPYGRILASLPLGEAGILDISLPQALPRTHFSMYASNITFYVILAFGLLSLILRRRH